jgi:hypothetical protein
MKGPFVMGPIVMGPFVMGPLVMGPYVGLLLQYTLEGFDFILIFLNFRRNQVENDRYWQKDKCFLYA